MMLYISRFVSSTLTHLKCFCCSSMSPSKFIAEKLLLTFYDLRWYRGHKERLLVAIFRFRVSILPVARYLRMFRMVSVRKRQRWRSRGGLEGSEPSLKSRLAISGGVREGPDSRRKVKKNRLWMTIPRRPTNQSEKCSESKPSQVHM